MLLVRAFAYVPMTVMMLFSDRGGAGAAAMRASQLGNLAATALVVASGVILLVFAPAIAARLAGEETVTTSITARDAFLVGAILLAVAFLVSGAKELVSAAYTLAMKPSSDERRSMSYVWERHAQIIPGAIVELIAGVLLLSRRRAYAERWFGEGDEKRLTGS
ncbi:MAG TPA: hypothetical protein VEO54_21055 [Thermoanaerobaculia bacterium]|nr:hypothetical protein [Thermoanaerobaculia bacterium]